jgi:hypothetical protein
MADVFGIGNEALSSWQFSTILAIAADARPRSTARVAVVRAEAVAKAEAAIAAIAS